MTVLNQQARAVLEGGRHADEPLRAERERVGQRLAMRLGWGTAALTTGASTWAASGLLNVLASAVLLGGVAGGVWWVYSGDEGGATPRVQRPLPVVTTPRPVTPSIAPEAVVRQAPGPLAPPPPATKAGPDKAARAPELPKASTLEAETALLSQVNQALRTGQPGNALSLLDDYDQHFPKGALREESAASRVVALCQQGGPGAVKRAERFVAAHPTSLQVRRVQRACSP